MRNYTEYSCPICGRMFTQDDDIVVCPDCGAPHHRECWKQIGHCTYADAHDTPNQWRAHPSRSDDDAVICGNCGTANEPGNENCHKCGHSLVEPEDSVPFMSPTVTDTVHNVAVPPSEEDAAVFIGSRAEYYLMRFHWMDERKSRLSWNWGAAFFPVEWLLYRKLRGAFFIALILMLVLMLPTLIMVVISYRSATGDAAALQDLLQNGQLPVAMPPWLSLLSDITGFLSMFLRGAFALAANGLYRRYVIRRSEQIRSKSTDPLYYRYALSKKGGTSVAGIVVYYLVLVAALIVGGLLLSL